LTVQDPTGYFNAGNTGAIYYKNSAGILVPLNPGSNGQVLTLNSNLPTWATPSSGGGGGQTVTVNASKTLALSDADTKQVCTGATSDVVITIPNDSTANLPVGTVITIITPGPYFATIDLEAGVSYTNALAAPVRRFTPVSASYNIEKTAANAWIAKNLNYNTSLTNLMLRLDPTTIQPAAQHVSGTGSTIFPQSDGSIIETLTSTASARCHFGAAQSNASGQLTHFLLSGKALWFYCQTRVSALAVAANTGVGNYNYRVGLIDNIALAPANGVYLVHSSNNSGNWQITSRAANVDTVINTAVNPTATTTFEMLIKNGIVRTWVNGVAQADITTNIPTAPLGYTFGSLVNPTTAPTTPVNKTANTLNCGLCRWL
jgi:hypothetical protein